MPSPRVLALSLACAALAVAGCGGSDSEQQSSAPTATPTQTETPAPAAPAKKPKVPKPRGKPPKKLVKKDLKVGKGAVAKPGSTVVVQYVGVSFKTGKQFDASWDRGQPFSFAIGSGQVIPGWEKGIPGMRVGGRRELVIPPKLAYGLQGSPPVIGPNETLVFVVDLLSVQ
jgi:peptidylprolyl isomerase